MIDRDSGMERETVRGFNEAKQPPLSEYTMGLRIESMPLSRQLKERERERERETVDF